jgi:hypothetical protein
VTLTVSLALVAVLALVSSLGSQARPDESGTAATPPPTPTPSQARTPTTRPPAERTVSQAGSGEVTVVDGRTRVSPGPQRVLAYRVLVEDGLTVDGDPVDGAAFAANVHTVLTDRRGWQAIDDVAFQRVSGESSDVDVVLASPDTTDALCAPLGTGGWLSCFNGSATVLNAARWFTGTESYGDDLASYRRYLVSHEMGHYLGHQHVDCPAPGEVAPVMVQQTKSLYGCKKGPWPASSR